MTAGSTVVLALDPARGTTLTVPIGATATVLCREARSRTRLRAEWSRRTFGERLASLAGRAPRLLVVETAPLRRTGVAVVCLSDDPSTADGADRLVVLRGTRIVVDAPPGELLAGCRRLTYRNEATESRESYGRELDAFFALQVKVRGWGIEAIVSGFDEAAFEAFCELDGVLDAEALPLTAAELFEALG